MYAKIILLVKGISILYVENTLNRYGKENMDAALQLLFSLGNNSNEGIMSISMQVLLTYYAKNKANLSHYTKTGGDYGK